MVFFFSSMHISTVKKETEISFMGCYAVTPNFFSSSHYTVMSPGTLKKATAEEKVRRYVKGL